MDNRQIEEKLRNAAKKVTPDVMDEVYRRIEAGSDPIVPMDLRVRKNRRSVWIPVLASAAALLLVANVGMFWYYHSDRNREVVELNPNVAASAQDGALLIDRIVQMDPEFTPEALSSYSVEELDTILRATQTRREVVREEVVTTNTPQEQPAEDTAVTENITDQQTAAPVIDARVSEDEDPQAQGEVAVSAVSDNTAVTTGTDEDPQPVERDQEVFDESLLTEDGAFAAVLKDAGVEKENVIHSVIEKTIHTSYGTLYNIDFETEKFTYHYRITETGTLLAAGRELKEDKEAE
ncbi:MAG: hypothetical protein K6G81_05870 [Lachnospiraceae bacterium]|nr:hypothetical protein [Lachnospiraceae bacterium]